MPFSHICNCLVGPTASFDAKDGSGYTAIQYRTHSTSFTASSLGRTRRLAQPGLTTSQARRRARVTPIKAAQSQDDSLLALPKQFYLGFASSLGITKNITRTQAYSVWLQGGVVLVILAAIDAAFSGDWSRIGVLSKEAELGLRPLLGLLGLFHVVCGTVTFLDASRKGYNPVPQTLKVLAVGFLATVEQLYKDPAE